LFFYYLNSNTKIVLKDVKADINTPTLLASNPLVGGSNGTKIVEPGFTLGLILNPRKFFVLAARPFA
jgi:hypothetical protein